jgi:hypothetical protein
LTGALIVALATSALAQPVAEDLLVDLGYDQVVEWTNLGSSNTSLTPSTGNGAIVIHSPGYQASDGFDSWAGNFATTVTATPLYSGNFTDIKTVVLQLAGAMINGNIENENFDYTLEKHLTVDGGPVLYYYLASDNPETTPARIFPGFPTQSGSLGQLPGTAHDVTINYVGFTYMWDLTGLESSLNPVTWVSVYAPILQYSSTIGAQLAFGSTYDSNFFETFADADGNGLLDEWEITHFGHTGVDPAADPDSDSDSLTNLAEFLAGTNPNTPATTVSPTTFNLIIYSP